MDRSPVGAARHPEQPLFACAVCRQHVEHESFQVDRGTHVETVAYANADGDPLCLADFLIANPHHLEDHRRRELPREIDRRVAAALAAASVPAALTPAPRPAPIAPAPAKDAEETE